MTQQPVASALSLTDGFSPVISLLMEWDEIHLTDALTAQRLMRISAETDPWVWAAAALALARLRHGSACVDLQGISTRLSQLTLPPGTPETPQPWEDPQEWAQRIAASPASSSQVTTAGAPDDSQSTGQAPLIIEGMLVYLRQYHQAEVDIAQRVVTALKTPHSGSQIAAPPEQLDQLLDTLFPAASDGTNSSLDQKHAAHTALTHRLSIITGGPGSGKTTTISRVLAGILSLDPTARIALAAPTGKAAARMSQSIQEATSSTDFPLPELAEQLQQLPTVTIHRLLGLGHHRTTPKFHQHNPLPYEVVIVDEVSMVPLILMQQIIAALRPQAHIVLVGDAHQLQSVDAGNVFADLVNGLSGQPALATLTHSRRFNKEIGQLAESILTGKADQALQQLADTQSAVLKLITYQEAEENLLRRIEDAFDLANAIDLADSAYGSQKIDPENQGKKGSVAATLLQSLEDHRILCAHREGPAGEKTWNERVKQWLASRRQLRYVRGFYVGQPVMVTANDYHLGLANGDSGIICLRNGQPVVLLDTAPEPRILPLSRVPHLVPAHALTIHRAQGSQARHISVVLPPPESPLLNRELFYTAVTRAKETLTLIAPDQPPGALSTPTTHPLGGADSSIRAAIQRQAQRTSGLAERLLSAWE